MTARRQSETGKLSRKFRPINLEQLEARMMCTVSGLEQTLQTYFTPLSTSNSGSESSNTAPTLATRINSNGLNVTTVTTTKISLSALGKDDSGESLLKYNWAVTQLPTGATATFSNNQSNSAKNTVLTFSKIGVYNVELTITDGAGKSFVTSQRITVAPTLSRVYLRSLDQVLSSDAVINTSRTSLVVQAQGYDQFGALMTSVPTDSWKSVSVPVGGSQSVTVRGNTATISFTKAGTYGLEFAASGFSNKLKVNVSQVLSSVSLTPGTTTVNTGGIQQFTAVGQDQFKFPMASQPAFIWTTSGGTITAQGRFTAPSSAANYTITVTSGLISARATVTVKATEVPAGFKNASISDLVQTYFADGSITRPEMIQLLRSAGSDGTVDATELADLRYVVTNASRYNIAGYVQVLAGNVVNSNPANSSYQGSPAGNLAAGNSATQLNNLVDKWFLGTDRPTLTNGSITYRAASGSLFVGAPTYANEKQGMLGDCYFIAALGSLGSTYADAVKNMFVDNGDGTYTVRFFGGNYGGFYNADGTVSDGFANGVGVADYVTVDRVLPTNSNGTFAYSNYGMSVTSSTNVLWIALAEKAYAQWNANGKSGRTPANSYAAIEGGWMSNVNAQVLGYNSTRYSSETASNKQALINALKAGNAVTAGSKSNSTALVGSHAYSITAYNASTDTFSLFNPWGTSHPAPLSWSQIQSNTTGFVVANALKSSPVTGSVAGAIASVRGETQPWSTAYATPMTAARTSVTVVLTTDEIEHVDIEQADYEFADETLTSSRNAMDEGMEFTASAEHGTYASTRDAVDMLMDIDRIEELLGDLLS